jgi:simple sugar transport system ATP-binding protein
MTDAPIIEMREIVKLYGGVAAVDGVNFALRRGEIHSLLGENGAGKSTLTKIMAGAAAPTRGEMRLDGRAVVFSTPAEAMASGVGMVFQENSLVPSMSVAQNLFLGDESFFNRLRPLYIAAQQFLQSLNFNVDPWATVASLGVAKKQMVEIARAVRQKARVIIFDEPTASLTPEEKHHFFALIRRLKQDGVSIIFISHALEEALEISDRITVLRDGKVVVTDAASAFDRDRIITSMVGRTLSTDLYRSTGQGVRKPGEKLLSVQNLSQGKMVRNTSFSIYAGQITGIFGLIGSGRTETARIIAGITKRNFFHGGETRLGGDSVRYRVPRDAVRDGIVYVTEDRKVEGFFDTMSISENIGLNHIAAGLNKGWIVRTREIAALAQTWTKQLNVRAISPNAKIVELSGGNQQKVVIAKSLAQKPRLVIFDEPTRGVDVSAIAEIHHIIQKLADEGLAVVLISSYLPEVLNLSDRILVSRMGRIVEEFRPGAATEEKIMYAAVH